MYTVEDVMRIQESRAVGERTGVEVSARAIAAQAAEGAPGSIAEGALGIRGTFMEEVKQATAGVQMGLIEPGRQFAETMAIAANATGNRLQEFSGVIDDTAANMIAMGTTAQIGALGIEAMSNVIRQIPGVGEDMAAAMEVGLVGKLAIGGVSTALTAREQQDRNFELLGLSEDDTSPRAQNLRKMMAETHSFTNVTQASRGTISRGGKVGREAAEWLADPEKQRALEASITQAGNVAGAVATVAWERTKDAAVGTANATYDMIDGIGTVVPVIGVAMDLLETGAKKVKSIFIDEEGVEVPIFESINSRREVESVTQKIDRVNAQGLETQNAADKKNPQLDEQTLVLKEIATAVREGNKTTPQTTQSVAPSFTVGQQRAASFEQKQEGRP